MMLSESCIRKSNIIFELNSTLYFQGPLKISIVCKIFLLIVLNINIFSLFLEDSRLFRKNILLSLKKKSIELPTQPQF